MTAESPPSANVPPPSSAAQQRIALLLVDIGSPGSPEEVRPFLQSLYEDPRVLSLPVGGSLHSLVASMVTLFKASAVGEMVRTSPAPERATLQTLAQTLCERLTTPERVFVPYVGYRHANPTLKATLERIVADGCRRVIAVWARPFPSWAGSDSAFVQLALDAEERGLDLSTLDHYDDDPAMREAWARVTKDALETIPSGERDSAHLVFTLQGLPLEGSLDPSLDRAKSFAEAVKQAAGIQTLHTVAYQCRTEPRAPLAPDVRDELERAAKDKKSAFVVVPLFHPCETLATRWELDVALREEAKQRGLTRFVRAVCPCERPDFPAALVELVRRHVEQMEQLRVTA